MENYFLSTIRPGVDPKKVRTMLYGVLLTMVMMAYYAIICYVIDFKIGLFIQLILTFMFLCFPMAIKYGLSLTLLGNIFALSGLIGIFTLSRYTGGIDSPILPWISLVPLVALLFLNLKQALKWVIFALLALMVMQYLSTRGMTNEIHYNPKYRELLYINCYLGLVLILFLLNSIFTTSLEKANAILELKNKEINLSQVKLIEQSSEIALQRDIIITEKKKTDNLLLNVLPQDIAEELKQNGHCEARQYHNVSILFTDFVDFTKYCEYISPTKLIEQLHYYFQRFDEIIERHDLEKIKTIGDSYMAVSGLPISNPNHALNAVNAAIEMQSFVNFCRSDTYFQSPFKERRACFQMRVGIHTGSVIAGVVGTKKFAFDIWGDAVNTAARIQQNAIPDSIDISRDIYSLIKDEISCTQRGNMMLKGKGEMELYTVANS